jgi:hypothetical protein
MQREAACSREQGKAFKPEFGVTSLQMPLCLPLGYIEYALLNPKYILNLMAYILQYFTDVFQAVVPSKFVYISTFLSFLYFLRSTKKSKGRKQFNNSI